MKVLSDNNIKDGSGLTVLDDQLFVKGFTVVASVRELPENAQFTNLTIIGYFGDRKDTMFHFNRAWLFTPVIATFNGEIRDAWLGVGSGNVKVSNTTEFENLYKSGDSLYLNIPLTVPDDVLNKAELLAPEDYDLFTRALQGKRYTYNLNGSSYNTTAKFSNFVYSGVNGTAVVDVTNTVTANNISTLSDDVVFKLDSALISNTGLKNMGIINTPEGTRVFEVKASLILKNILEF